MARRKTRSFTLTLTLYAVKVVELRDREEAVDR